MESLSMCRICLVTDVRLCSISSHLRDMYERITSLTFKREDRRPLVACYICHARLQNCYQLWKSCLRSEELLTEMMSSGVIKSQDMLSTNTLGLTSVVHLSLGHEMLNSTEGKFMEETLQVICDSELDRQCTKDIKILVEPQEYDARIGDEIQCSLLENALKVIKREPDEVETYVEDITLEIENITFNENELYSAQQSSLSAYNICPVNMKVELDKMVVNDTILATGVCVLKNPKAKALKGTEDNFTIKGKNEVENKENTKNITNKEHKTVTKKWRGGKKITSCNLLETCDKLDVNLNKFENGTAADNDICKEKSIDNTFSEHSISNSKNKQFSCNTCKKKFSDKSHLKSHFCIHTGELYQYQCNICKLFFDEISDLQKHIRLHTDDIPYQCNVCKRSFNSKYVLKHHINAKTCVKIQCKNCKKRFIKVNLNKHYCVNTGVKPYKCKVCRKSFVRKGNLIKHSHIHTADKPSYQCIVCKKYCINNSALKVHIRTHTGEKPYQCNLCKKCFSSKCSLKKHIRTHTGEKPYRCNYCNRCFNDLSNYSKHNRLHLRKLDLSE